MIEVETSWNVIAHAQKPDFVFLRNGRVHLNRQGGQFRRIVAAEVCASAVVMLDTPCSEVVWRVLATQSIRQFPLHFRSRALPRDFTFQLESVQLLSATSARSIYTVPKRKYKSQDSFKLQSWIPVRLMYIGPWNCKMRMKSETPWRRFVKIHGYKI